MKEPAETALEAPLADAEFAAEPRAAVPAQEPRPSQRSKPPVRSGAIWAGLSFLLLKALPAAKFLVTSLSMLAMVWVEAQRTGPWFAVGFVLMILVHELGHGYAMKRRGVEAGWPVFIPFVGAMISMKNTPRDRDTEADIAYGGPLAGTMVALLAAGVGLALGSRPFIALAYTGFFLNLFNLTPISPLDGGRVAQAFSRRAWIIGVILLGAIFLWTHSPQLLSIALLALPRLFSRASKDAEAERDALEPAQQRAWAIRYFGLAAFLGSALYFSGSLLGRF